MAQAPAPKGVAARLLSPRVAIPAGGILAPFIAGNLNLLGVPGWSGRQQDFYEQDQPSAPLAKADLQAIQDLMP